MTLTSKLIRYLNLVISSMTSRASSGAMKPKGKVSGELREGTKTSTMRTKSGTAVKRPFPLAFEVAKSPIKPASKATKERTQAKKEGQRVKKERTQEKASRPQGKKTSIPQDMNASGPQDIGLQTDSEFIFNDERDTSIGRARQSQPSVGTFRVKEASRPKGENECSSLGRLACTVWQSVIARLPWRLSSQLLPLVEKHKLTGLSLMRMPFLNDALGLDLSGEELDLIHMCVEAYRVHEDLPDPAIEADRCGNRLETVRYCLAGWMTEFAELNAMDAYLAKHFVTGTRWRDLFDDLMSAKELAGISLGTKLATLYTIGRMAAAKG